MDKMSCITIVFDRKTITLEELEEIAKTISLGIKHQIQEKVFSFETYQLGVEEAAAIIAASEGQPSALYVRVDPKDHH
jgi:hypothetical protein